MNRDQAILGVDQRIGALLLRRTQPYLTGIPINGTRPPRFALPAKDTGTRVCRGMRLMTPAGADMFALFGGEWQQAGFQPRWVTPPQGQALVATDPDGYILLLWRPAEQAELYVISPPATSLAGLGFLIAGFNVGVMAGCASSFLSVATYRSAPRNLSDFMTYLPGVLLLGGGLMFSARTRSFGLGLMIGGAVASIVVAGFCTSLIA